MPSTNSNQDFQSHLFKLQIHFRGQLRAQLKPLAVALGIGENTVRNNGNIFFVNGKEIRPSIVNRRITFDLSEVADALAAQVGDPVLPVPKVHAARGRGRPRKVELVVADGGAA